MKKLKVLLFASMSLLLASFFGCEMNSTPNEEDGKSSRFTVSGYAKFDNADNHSGIKITLEQTDGLAGAKYAATRGIRSASESYFKQTTTDSSGKYEFKDVPKGTYTVYASANNTVEKAAMLTNRSVEKDTVFENLGLTATGNISGQITIDGSTDNVFGYEVLILGTSYSASIDTDGKFTISNIPAKLTAYNLCFVGGTYRYIFQKDVTVTASKTTELETKDISSEEWKDYKFEWLGAKDEAPEDAVKNQAYFNTQDGCSYIFNGTEWELLAQAGSDGKDGQDGKDAQDISEQYVSISATDRGIRFEARILNNITESGNYSQHNALVTFNVSREGSDVQMVRNWTKNSTGWMTCEMYYPFVEAGETYNFTFEAIQGDYVLYRKNFTIEATGGLGELELTGDTDYEVELTENRVIQFTTDVTKLQAKNANIIDVATAYELYTSEWNWIFAGDKWASTTTPENMVLDLKSESNWKKFDVIDNSMKGHDYMIFGEVRVKIAGYQDNGQTYFRISRKQKIAPWELDSEKIKVYIVYGSYPEEYGEYISNLPGTKGTATIKPEENPQYEVAVYYDVKNYNEVLYEPTQTPTYKNLPDSKFNGWTNGNNTISFPYGLTPSKAEGAEITIDGNKAEYFITVVPDITPYVKATIMDVDTEIATNVLIDLNNLNSISIPNKDDAVVEGIYTNKECSEPFNNEKVNDILVNGADNLCLYTKWIETKSLWTGESYGSLRINYLADDIGSDSVFYIEVYNDSSYDRETRYYMRDQNYNGSNTDSDIVTVPANGTALLKISPSARDIAYMKQNGIYIDSNYNSMRIRSVRYTPTVCVNVNVMDGESVYTNIVLNNLSDVNSISNSIPRKDDFILDGLYTDAECTIPFTQESITEILESGNENPSLYTKWVETKTLWTGDNVGSLYLNDWADDIGSDSVFYIEVYNQYHYARETLYYMRDRNNNGSTTPSDYVTVPAFGTAFLKISPSASDIAYMKQNGIYISNSYDSMCIRSVRYTPTACVNVNVMDGESVYKNIVLNNLSDVNSITINILGKENAFLEGLYTDTDCTIPFTQDSISEILGSGVENACLYTKWIEAKTLWEGDVWPGICIDDFADDIGSDSVFYIEVYNNSSDDIETQYYMCDQNGYGSTTYSDYVTVPANGTALLKISPSASDIAYMKQYGICSYNSNSSKPMSVRSVRYTPSDKDPISAEVTPKAFTISFNGKQYSAGVFTTTDDWESIEITFAEVPSTDQVQFCLVSDSVESEQSWGTSYYSKYPQVAEVVTIILDDWLNKQADDSGKTLADQGATKITSVNIQAKTTETPDVKVKSAIVTKKDGTKEAVVAAQDWATTVTED